MTDPSYSPENRCTVSRPEFRRETRTSRVGLRLLKRRRVHAEITVAPGVSLLRPERWGQRFRRGSRTFGGQLFKGDVVATGGPSYQNDRETSSEHGPSSKPLP